MTIALITRALIDSVILPSGAKKVRIHDTKTRNLFAEKRATSTTFYVRIIDERKRRHEVKLGRHGVITVEQARKRAEELQAQMSLGRNPIAERDARLAIPTVDRLASRYLDWSKEHLRSWRNCVAYDKRIRQFFSRKALNEVSVTDVEDFRRWLLGLGLSNASVNRHLATLRSMFNLAKKWSLWDGANPAASPGMLREQHRTLYLDATQTQGLFQALDLEPNRDAASAIAFLALTGARKSEALQARWEFVDYNRSLLVVPRSKHGGTRYIPLSPHALMVLKTQHRRRRDDGSYIFPGGSDGQPLEDLRGPWRRAKAAAGLPAELRIHDLRHSFASALCNEGVPISEIGVILGHRTLATTQRYSHHNSERLVTTATRAATSWNLLPSPPAALAAS